MQALQLNRRTYEAIALSVIALATVACLRSAIESRLWFSIEMVSIGVVFAIDALRVFRHRAFAFVLIATPIIVAMFARASGSPVAFEMTALTTFGAASLAMSTGSARTRAMSLVSSGFLTLFAVAISDKRFAVLFAIAWLAVCVWHLVANHWERLELCAVRQVKRGTGVRPASVAAAVSLFLISGFVAKDRFGESTRFNFGVMPTSGGSKWSDPAAQSGVGTGDSVIAAKDHAESFGAVESDLFLESNESTLFDMFNDSIGEPKKKPVYELRQALSATPVLESHQKTAKSEKGGSSFSADRKSVKKHMHLEDAVENAVVQWAGPTGIRLAMNRYDTFDGSEWTNSAKLRNENLSRRAYGEAAWYMEPNLEAVSLSTPEVSLLKVLRLNSPRIPAPMLTFGVHIKDVDRPDFFAIEDDGSLFMPGRIKVPALTVVNVASTKMMEDEIWQRLSDTHASLENSGPLAALAKEWTAHCTHPYEKLQAIVTRLRSDFVFDRTAELSGDDAISQFLTTRCGGDHLFATTAALLAREIGLQSRLVTGFYVRSSATDIASGHANVLPDDVHVWAEVRLDENRWFEIEATPGYQQPVYQPSGWLIAKQFASTYWVHMLAGIAFMAFVFATRLYWIELGLTLLYRFANVFWPRGQTVIAMRVLQTRAKYAGCPRAVGRPQRDWLLGITSPHEPLRETARRFCDAADKAAFGGTDATFHQDNVSKELLMKLKIPVLRSLAAEISHECA